MVVPSLLNHRGLGQGMLVVDLLQAQRRLIPNVQVLVPELIRPLEDIHQRRHFFDIQHLVLLYATSLELDLPGVIPAVLRVCRHLPSDFLKWPAIGIHPLQDLPVAIVAPLEFPLVMIRDRLAEFLIHELDIVNIVHVVGKAPEGFWHFALGIPHIVERLG